MKELKFKKIKFKNNELTLKKKDPINNLLEQFIHEGDYAPNLWHLNRYFRSKNKQISFIPIIQIYDHSDEWFSFLDIGIIQNKKTNKYFLFYNKNWTPVSERPEIIKEFRELPNFKILKKHIFKLLNRERADLKQICNMVFLSNEFKWNVNELIKFFKPFHKYRLSVYKFNKDDDTGPRYQYYCIWFKFLKK